MSVFWYFLCLRILLLFCMGLLKRQSISCSVVSIMRVLLSFVLQKWFSFFVGLVKFGSFWIKNHSNKRLGHMLKQSTVAYNMRAAGLTKPIMGCRLFSKVISAPPVMPVAQGPVMGKPAAPVKWLYTF